MISMLHTSSKNHKTLTSTHIDWIDNGLLFLGTLIVLGAIVLVNDFGPQIIIAGVGILMIGIGIGRYTSRFFARQRHYNALRSEFYWFHSLVQKLNDAALSVKANDVLEARQSFEDIREAMRESVERMADVAGKTDAELTSNAGQQHDTATLSKF